MFATEAHDGPRNSHRSGLHSQTWIISHGSGLKYNQKSFVIWIKSVVTIHPASVLWQAEQDYNIQGSALRKTIDDFSSPAVCIATWVIMKKLTSREEASSSVPALFFCVLEIKECVESSQIVFYHVCGRKAERKKCVPSLTLGFSFNKNVLFKLC